MTDLAVQVVGLGKVFRRYRERNQSFKSAVLRGGRSRYELDWALRHVELDITTGTTYGLIGDNGSGKSTLLKCLARILVPDEGSVRVHGRVAALLELGSGFHPELTGRQNVFLNGAILGISKRELNRRLDAIIDFAGLDAMIDQPVKNYSSGMYVRLGFAIATNVQPEVLLIDEVLAVGDAAFQRKCIERIQDVSSAGGTVVIVSHAAESIRLLCDEVAWLEHGRLVEVGAATDVVPHYLRAGVEERPQVAGDVGRWGDGQILVESVQLIDAAGHPTTKVVTGEPMTVRMTYDAPGTRSRRVFGVAIYSSEGTLVWGSNTGVQRIDVGVKDAGVVEWTTPALALQPGVYDLDASATDRTTMHIHDYRRKVLRFDVQPGARATGVGLVDLQGAWSAVPGQPLSGDRA